IVTFSGGVENAAATISSNFDLYFDDVFARDFRIYGESNTLTISGALFNDAGMGFLKALEGRLVLTGQSTFTGGVQLSAGVLEVTNLAMQGEASSIGTG